MAGPELEDEPVGIIRSMETRRESLIEVTLVLLVHVPAISRANSPPACRKDSDTANGIYRVVVEGIRRLAARVHCRTHFADQLEVLVDHVVKSQS